LFGVTASLNAPSYHIHRFDGRRFKNIRVIVPAGVVPTWGWNQLFVQERSQQWWVPTTSGLFQFPTVHALDELPEHDQLKPQVHTKSEAVAKALRHGLTR
jgi:hypothetical protein